MKQTIYWFKRIVSVLNLIFFCLILFYDLLNALDAKLCRQLKKDICEITR